MLTAVLLIFVQTASAGTFKECYDTRVKTLAEGWSKAGIGRACLSLASNPQLSFAQIEACRQKNSTGETSRALVIDACLVTLTHPGRKFSDHLDCIGSLASERLHPEIGSSASKSLACELIGPKTATLDSLKQCLNTYVRMVKAENRSWSPYGAVQACVAVRGRKESLKDYFSCFDRSRNDWGSISTAQLYCRSEMDKLDWPAILSVIVAPEASKTKKECN